MRPDRPKTSRSRFAKSETRRRTERLKTFENLGQIIGEPTGNGNAATRKTKLFLVSYFLVKRPILVRAMKVWQPDCMSFIHVCSVRVFQ